jgi:hypothetical protein
MDFLFDAGNQISAAAFPIPLGVGMTVTANRTPRQGKAVEVGSRA